MEVLPSSSSLFTPTTAVDCSSVPCSASFQQHRTSRSLMRPQSAPRTRISVFEEDKNWLGKLSLAISDYKLYAARRPAASHLLTLSPIIASPVCPPTPTYALDSSSPEIQPNSPASTEYATAPNSPSIPPLFAPLPSMLTSSSSVPRLATHQSSSEALGVIALSLLASTSFSAIIPSHAIDGAAGLQETDTPRHMQPTSKRLRSFSDPSLSPRQAVVDGYSEQPGTPLHVLPESRAKDNSIMSRNRAKFHIPLDPKIDSEEGDSPLDSCERTNCDSNPEDDHGSSNLDPNSVESRDVTRRFHALKELLTTEYGYLNDLKALVNVYLRDLPAMTLRMQCLTRIPSFLMTGTRNSHSSHLYSQPSEAESDRSRLTQRHCFSECEIELLTRNALALLHLHEGFLQELEATVKIFGVTVNPQQDDVSGPMTMTNIDAAIQAVAQKFLQQASHFHIYQDFCAGHLEALDIVRMKQHQYPVEWDAFEHRCASVILAQADRNSFASESRSSPGSSPGIHETTLSVDNDRKRTASLTALDGAMRTLRAFTSKENVSSQFDMRHDKHARRLAFMDYLIKPIQRICKYPLLLDQLRPVGSSQDVTLNIDMIVESIQAIKNVLAAVDEARHQKEIATKTSLIASRILLSSTSGCTHHLSNVFVSSLGTCLLAGSLVMIHYLLAESKGDFSNAKPERVGAFLYPGGYLILVQVLKGKIYEPKHWFCLANFDIRDMADGASISSSFCLLSKIHIFEFAAACPRERTVWVSTIRESLTQSPTWADIPISSLDSMNPRETEIKPHCLNAQSNSDEEQTKITSSWPDNFVQDDAYFKHDYVLDSTRASSSVSLKTIFAQGADMNATVLRRSSTIARQQTVDGLQDVVWRACLGGRTCRHHSRQEVFQEAKTNVSSFIRSNSAISLKGLTRSRLPKDETRRVLRHNSLPNGGCSSSNTELSKVKSMIVRDNRYYNGESANSEAHHLSSLLPEPDILTDQALSPSPTTFLAETSNDAAHGLSRGIFRNVKGLFHARSTRTVDNSIPSLQRSSLQRAKSASNIFRRLSTKKLFQRNAPEIPEVVQALDCPNT